MRWYAGAVAAPAAVRLLEGAVHGTGGTWADLGCGDGTFTLALAELLGPAARIYAVDHNPGALSRLRGRARGRAGVIPVEADFTRPLDLLGGGEALDGLLFANSLHYVPEPERVLATWTARLRPGGRAVFVEYDRRSPSRWVPHPIPPARLEEVALSAGLSAPVITSRQPSAYAGTLYAAFSTRPLP